jgi:PhnB protein
MAQINPYLVFNGNCEAAFLLYKSVFGKDFSQISRFSDMPNDANTKMSENEANKIMHVSLPISEGFNLMGSDTNSDSALVQFGDNVSISINAESRAEASHLFHGLSEGGVVKMDLQDTFWGAFFGMFTDRFGVHWMINFDKPSLV